MWVAIVQCGDRCLVELLSRKWREQAGVASGHTDTDPLGEGVAVQRIADHLHLIGKYLYVEVRCRSFGRIGGISQSLRNTLGVEFQFTSS